jgi:uncharacterized protein YdhG (YjbR/CyaY superfamily)
MAAARQAPASVDAYVAGFPPDVRAILEQLRVTARKLLPDAQETISYGIPTYKRNGAVVYFAAFKAHIGFYPPVRGNAALEKAVARYAGDKGNLRFPLDEPLPMALIERIVRHQAKRDATSAKKR